MFGSVRNFAEQAGMMVSLPPQPSPRVEIRPRRRPPVENLYRPEKRVPDAVEPSSLMRRTASPKDSS
jgi:hypothetical protein